VFRPAKDLDHHHFGGEVDVEAGGEAAVSGVRVNGSWKGEEGDGRKGWDEQTGEGDTVADAFEKDTGGPEGGRGDVLRCETGQC
jgi:hypothetical protein